MMGPSIVVLSGGVGGARFVDGVAQLVPADRLTVVVNTGDDFTHWGLRICPDLDTVMYTLSGWADSERGWGLADESFRALEMIQGYGGESWFQIGDRDLGTHLYRTQALASGHRLTDTTAGLCKALSIAVRVLPMSDEPCPTLIETEHEGTLPFQDWLVRRRAEPRVRAICFPGSERASEDVLAALARADLVLIAPSNPYVSILPITRLRGVTEVLRDRCVVGVSPLIHGEAVKGPLGSMIRDLSGRVPSADAVASEYRSFLKGFLVAPGDGTNLPLPFRETDILMKSRADRKRVAEALLHLAEEIR